MGDVFKDRLPADRLTDDELSAFMKGAGLVAESDRRSSVRRAFCCVRLAADYKSGQPTSDFYRVLCRDLSTSGIGFFSPKRPTSRSVVIRLTADGERPVLIAGDVVYCHDKSGELRFPWIVGCVFTKRILGH